MRNRLLVAVLLPVTLALAAPDFVADFLPALEDSSTQSNETIAEEGGLELVKRQTGCANGYASCGRVGAPGLCCRTNQVCSADIANHVACCPLGAACTGTIGGVIPGSQPTVIATATTSTVPFVIATTTQSGPSIGTQTDSFVQQTGSASNARSTVPNEFYPFAVIPTTYINAAACSSAYTSCQTDAASCTVALANGQQGVTVSAPNGGVTITAIASLGPERANSICASLSSLACSGLQVEACASFGSGNAAAGRRGCIADAYTMGAAVAVGIAGQMLR
ncbi:hypothetical protein BDV95DRAFT_576503 [Massariosphaeria phaeospora]|uniref:Uncharacterized protein n=1 Tax=Massariosphaeria phaeospora TaxID=100035 RepID=A0A7C8I3F1_9PLEO|nr:hypothetical protein BDV95DRAFT_576503 [Massariosphaeria phaeospora]